MGEDPIRAACDQWTRGLDPVAARVALFERVRDLPYQYPSSCDPIEVLTAGRGSCPGKHDLLGRLFQCLGSPVRHMLCTHRFNESPLPFPDEMQALLKRNEIIDVHEYVQICVEDQWIDIDATWQLGLRDFGFPVTDEWDGRSSMLLTVFPDEQIPVNSDRAKLKEEVLARLTPRQRALRKQFLDALGRWVQELAVEISPAR